MNSPFYHLSHRSSVKALHTGWTPTEFVQWFWRIHEKVVYNIVDLSWLYHLFEENKCCAERRLLEKTNSEQCTRELSSLPHWPAVDPHVVSIVVAYPRTVNHQEVPNLEMTIPYCNNESSSRETRHDTSVCRWSWVTWQLHEWMTTSLPRQHSCFKKWGNLSRSVGKIGVWVENFGLALEALRETTHSRQIKLNTDCQLWG